MTAITAEKCERAIKACRKNGRRLEKEVKNAQAAQAFKCSRQGRKVTPAKCHDCFESLEPSLRLATNDKRENCIAIHKTQKSQTLKSEDEMKKFEPIKFSEADAALWCVVECTDPACPETLNQFKMLRIKSKHTSLNRARRAQRVANNLAPEQGESSREYIICHATKEL